MHVLQKFIGWKLKIYYKITLDIEIFAASDQDIYTKYKTGVIRSGHSWAFCLVCGDIVQTKV
jgi:hypothetical protein